MSNSHLSFLSCFVAFTAFFASSAASADITGTAWNARKRPPAPVSEGLTENDNGIRGMDENLQCFTDAFPAVDAGTQPTPGQSYVECHLLHFDPVNDPLTRTGRFKFDNEIMALVYSSGNLDAWDGICDDAIGMGYPAAGSEPFRGLEPTATPADQVTLTPNPAGRWNRVEVTAEVRGNTDHVRVITCCDDVPDCDGVIPDWSLWPGI